MAQKVGLLSKFFPGCRLGSQGSQFVSSITALFRFRDGGGHTKVADDLARGL